MEPLAPPPLCVMCLIRQPHRPGGGIESMVFNGLYGSQDMGWGGPAATSRSCGHRCTAIRVRGMECRIVRPVGPMPTFPIFYQESIY
jgi:hypothetical protein